MDQLQALAHLRNTPLSEIPAAAKAMRTSKHTLIKVKYGTTKYPRLPLLKKIVVWAESRTNGA
jgi:hypothetical protein